MTFSLVARCPDSRLCGIAIASSSPAVAARCVHTRAGVGAVASQNVTDPALGTALLDLMADGHDAPSALATLLAGRTHTSYRQLLAVDAAGCTAIHSGPNALGTWSEASGDGVVSGGNLLAHADVPAAIIDAFSASAGHLGDRLLAALQAGLAAGGEAGPVHSAGLQLCDRLAWPVADLRCDWTEACPIEAVATAWDVYRPQMDAYVTRAQDPTRAPSYGVPGDA